MVGDPKDVPSIGKHIPLIVLTESMEDEIMAGDLIICEKVNPQNIKKGDVISFFDPAGSGTSIVTHKVYEVNKDAQGKITSFKTYGVNNYIINNGEKVYSYDTHSVSVDDVVGIYRGARIAGVGHVALFMQSTWGLIICIALPIGAFVIYEVIRRKKVDKSKQDDMDKLKAELEALKLAQANATAEQADDASIEQAEQNVQTTVENTVDEKGE
jgi:signal peptidase